MRIERTTLTRMLAAVFMTGALVAPSPAFAQDGGGLDEETQRVITTLGVLTTVGLTVYFLQGATDRFLDKVFEDATAYINENPTGLQEASATGAGAAVEDLGAIFRLRDHELAGFGARLRAERELVATMLAAPKVTRDQVALLAHRTLTAEQLERLRTAASPVAAR